MSLQRFLEYLTASFVPDLPARSQEVSGWLGLLREKLTAAREQLGPSAPPSTHTAILQQLKRLFESRPFDVKRYLDDFEHARLPATTRAPGSLHTVGTIDTGHLPSNENARAQIDQLVDAIDAQLRTLTPQPAVEPKQPVGAEPQS